MSQVNMLEKSIEVSIWKPTEDDVYTRTGRSGDQTVEGSIVNSNSSEKIKTAILNITFHPSQRVSKHHILGFTLPGSVEDNVDGDILVERHIPIVLIVDHESTILEYTKCRTGHDKIVKPCFAVIERGKAPKITPGPVEGKFLSIAWSDSCLALAPP